MKKILLFTILLLSNFLFSQALSSPESVEWDEANSRWLIGNSGNGTIITRSIEGVNTAFISGIPSGPYGVEIVGDEVFCCAGGFIRGYNLSNGTNVFNLNVNGTFLNGLTSDGNNFLFTTDFSAKKILKIDITNSSYTTIASGLTKTPNGIFYDSENNRCVFVNWGSNAPIMAIDLTTFEVTTVLNTTLGNCDGITRDSCGNYYVTAWSNNKLNKFNPSLTGTFTVIPGTLTSPADIDCRFGTTEDVIGIPNSGNVTFLTIQNPEAIITFENNVLICGTTFEAYQWYLDAVLIGSATSQSFSPTMNGSYYCEIQSANCIEISNTIVVSNLSNSYFEVNPRVTLYPNPSANKLYLNNYNHTIEKYQIYNSIGQKVNSTLYENQFIDISSLENGVYFLKLETEKGVEQLSFIKSN